ncbi:sugar phosphate nucleotidyltransferase [Tumebacillus lipolyticus]|uniref:Sugar phosphate nucleotidyltransferase n=1 Tax=Tumebacillus lipolyticus TaxID=1280370 RepID=A0ABW4ZTW5_9BACL
MKAVILAGGKGSRLRPLTCNKPKPMVPLLGQPCMGYAIDLLRSAGVEEIAVTLQYLPDVIRDYFGDGAEHGVSMCYYEESTPLGTAGSVKHAQEFLDETFLVMSGDALTDFDLLQALQDHKEKGAAATILLTRVDSPLEFGVVITETDGRIVRFLEKPSWGEVFSDMVNTGIYILERDVLELIPAGREFDFSKDLFPILMQRGYHLNGYVAAGYWSDIGNLAQYRQTQFDMLDGKANCQIRGFRISPQVWLSPDVQIAEGVQLEGPCYIGRESVIEAGAQIGPYSVIGECNVIKAGASIRRSVLWNRNYLGAGVELRGASLCSHVSLESHSSCFEGAVIGDRCSLGAKAVVKQQVKLWPGKRVQEGTTVHTSLVWGEKLERTLFGLSGVQGIGNVEITPDFAGRLAAAYGATLPFGAKIALASDSDPFAALIKSALATGLRAAGVHTVDCQLATTPMMRYAVRAARADGGIYVRRKGASAEGRILIQFVDQSGINIDKGWERKIESAYWQEDFRRANLTQIGTGNRFSQLQAAYVADMIREVDPEQIKRGQFHLALQYRPDLYGSFVLDLLERLGCAVSVIDSREAAQGELQHLVFTGAFDLGVCLDDDGEGIVLVSDRSEVIEKDRLLTLQTLIYLVAGGERVAVPVTAPSIIETMAAKFGAVTVRTKANPRALMEAQQDVPFSLMFDALYTLLKLIDTLASGRKKLSELVESIPNYFLLRRDVPCPREEKGRVMRRLLEESKGDSLEMVDGIKVFQADGWALILPDSEEPLFQVFAQGVTERRAEEMADRYVEKILSYQNESIRGRDRAALTGDR